VGGGRGERGKSDKRSWKGGQGADRTVGTKKMGSNWGLGKIENQGRTKYRKKQGKRTGGEEKEVVPTKGPGPKTAMGEKACNNFCTIGKGFKRDRWGS